MFTCCMHACSRSVTKLLTSCTHAMEHMAHMQVFTCNGYGNASVQSGQILTCTHMHLITLHANIQQTLACACVHIFIRDNLSKIQFLLYSMFVIWVEELLHTYSKSDYGILITHCIHIFNSTLPEKS